MTNIYAGIGSQETPPDIQIKMTDLAIQLRHKGYILYSGGAKGADFAFELGAGPSKVSWRPHDVTPDAMELAKTFHPNWNRCGVLAKKLLARNGFQILGKTLDKPVKFVLCWTKDGKTSGGTGQALRIAQHYNVPIYNLKLLPNLTISDIKEISE